MAEQNTLVLPEHSLKNILDGLLAMMSDNLKQVPNKEQTMLYRMFGDTAYNKFKYYEQGVSLFTKSNGKARQIKTKLSFDGDLSQFPIIYIPTGKDDYSFSGIGDQDSNYVEDKDGRQTPMKTCRFKGESSFVIVSDSIEEVLLIYHAVRALLVAAGDTFGYYGLDTVQLGGADVQLNEEQIPKNVFMRAMSIKYEYDITIPSIIHSSGSGSITGMTGTGIPESTIPTN